MGLGIKENRLGKGASAQLGDPGGPRVEDAGWGRESTSQVVQG